MSALASKATARDSSRSLRKRRRTDDTVSSDVVLVEPEDAPVVVPIRDKEFYRDKEGADCVIQVEDTLFKVHRFLLTRDSTAFQDMFALPSSENTSVVEEGSSDDNPIVLYDKVKSFRALLRVLYALPTELREYNCVDTPLTGSSVSQLLTVAKIANKYQFVSLESWAVDAIYSSENLSSSSWRTTHSPDFAARMLAVAKLSDHQRLDTLVTEVWIARLLTRKREWCPHFALAIGDEYESRPLQGAAYYVLLMGMARVEDPQLGCSSFSSRGQRLTKDLHIRLLSGHWSLTESWESLRKTPPHHACRTKCIATWREVWSGLCDLPQVRNFRPEDVLGKLGYILRQGKDDPHGYFDPLQPTCREDVCKALRSLLLDIQDVLIDHFSDVV